MDEAERRAWLATAAAELADDPADPAEQDELLGLLEAIDPESARRELASLELRLKLSEEDPWIS